MSDPHGKLDQMLTDWKVSDLLTEIADLIRDECNVAVDQEIVKPLVDRQDQILAELRAHRDKLTDLQVIMTRGISLLARILEQKETGPTRGPVGETD